MIETDAFYAALDEGLAALAAGTPLAEVTRDLTARYPAYAAELPELLAAAHAAGVNAPLAPPPVRAQARSRAAFLGRAAALRQPPRRRAWAILSLPLARAALTVLVFAAGFGAGTYGAVVASADALPGEALYGIKRTVENTELLLTGDPQSRSALEAEFTKRRVDEVQQLTRAGRTAAVEFTGWLSAMDGERWVVAGLPVVVPAGTPINGTPRPAVWVRVAGVVQPDRTVRAERVEVLSDAEVPLPTATPAASATPPPTPTPAPTATRAATATRAVSVGEDVEFTGVVQSMGAGAWLIGGQAVAVTAATDLRDNPQVGDTVEVRAVRQADGSLLATRIRVEDAGDEDDGAATGAAPSSTPGVDDGDDDGDDDSGGGSGPSPSNTPEPGDDGDDDGGGDDGGGGDDNSGPSATNTPEPGDEGDDDGGDDDDSSGASPSNTPEPDDDGDDSDSGDSDEDDDNSGPSATNTPKPDEDDDDD